MEKAPYDGIINFKGVHVYWQLAPCSYMHRGDGMRFSLSTSAKMENVASVFLDDKSIPDMSREEFLPLAAEKARKAVNAAMVAKLEKLRVDWEKYQAESSARVAALKAAAERKQAEQDAEYKARGYTHRIDAWVHPPTGDDYAVQQYTSTTPTAAMIAKLLKRSTVKTDYKVVAL